MEERVTHSHAFHGVGETFNNSCMDEVNVDKEWYSLPTNNYYGSKILLSFNNPTFVVKSIGMVESSGLFHPVSINDIIQMVLQSQVYVQFANITFARDLHATASNLPLFSFGLSSCSYHLLEKAKSSGISRIRSTQGLARVDMVSALQ
jgi:hypothetical protein